MLFWINDLASSAAFPHFTAKWKERRSFELYPLEAKLFVITACRSQLHQIQNLTNLTQVKFNKSNKTNKSHKSHNYNKLQKSNMSHKSYKSQKSHKSYNKLQKSNMSHKSYKSHKSHKYNKLQKSNMSYKAHTIIVFCETCETFTYLVQLAPATAEKMFVEKYPRTYFQKFKFLSLATAT